MKKLVLVLILFSLVFGAGKAAMAAPLTALPASSTYDKQIGEKFADCAGCPEMVVVQGGWFVEYPRSSRGWREFSKMSDPANLIPANADGAFAFGRFDVTRRQYAQFVRETGRRPAEPGCQWLYVYWRVDRRLSWDHPGFAQSDDDPVVCISYIDASDYVSWLNSKLTPESKARYGIYRLPTGAEWEYVARRGATRTYDEFGDGAIRLDSGNFGAEECWPCGGAIRGRDRWLYTSPGGSFDPNAFGIYDIAGNVWQWTTECWDDAGKAPQAQGVQIVAAPAPDSCSTLILRGGSFDDVPGLWEWMMARNDYKRAARTNANGFRVIRSLTYMEAAP